MRRLCSLGFHAWRYLSIEDVSNDFAARWDYTRRCKRCGLRFKKRIFHFPRRIKT